MTRRSRSVIRSNSFLNMAKPYINDHCTTTYATCPPISLYQKRKLMKEHFNTTLSQLSAASSFATLIQAEWQKSRRNIEDKQLCLWEDLPSCYNKMIMQRSLPVFEVLPPLINTDIISLSSNKTFAKLSFTKLYKCINKKCKPSDSDVIFGDSKTLCEKCGWERSRIDWLVKLEDHIQVTKRTHLLYENENVNELNNLCCFPFILKPRTLYENARISSDA